MDEKITALFNINSVHYPHELALHYPNILKKIADLWSSSEIDDYFNSLIMDTRGDQRQGFPPKVAEEILRLSAINTKYRESIKPHSWIKIADIDRQELAQLGYKYSEHDYIAAARAGNAQAMNIFLRNRVPIETKDEQSWTALIHAAAGGHEALAYLLINHGASIISADRNGYGPLHWAAFYGHHNIVKLLLEHHADVNARSKLGWTPLMQAATQGHMVTVAFLLNAGADVNRISSDHWTALHKAAANGHTDVVKLLLSKGADQTVQRHNGSTALSLSTTGKHRAIVDILSSLPDAPTLD
jgi:uncharacterized protein